MVKANPLIEIETIEDFDVALNKMMELGYKAGLDGADMVETAWNFAVKTAENEGDDLISRMLGHG